MWSAMNKVYYEENNNTLLKLCADTYEQAYKNSSLIKVNCAYIHPKILGFRSFQYFPIRVELVTCEIEEIKSNVTSVFHITEGRGEDCVYFLEPSLLATMHYTLGDLVCNIPIDFTSKIKL